jgi:hypothetical protein
MSDMNKKASCDAAAGSDAPVASQVAAAGPAVAGHSRAPGAGRQVIVVQGPLGFVSLCWTINFLKGVSQTEFYPF